MTLLLRLYRAATALALPVVYRRVARRLDGQGIDAQRQGERRGLASRPRPAGALIWLHGASVGESLSMLSLIRALGTRHPDAHFLVTTGTGTSAQVLADRLPPRCIHQFAPLDAPAAVARFLDHWQPAMGIFVESELWPNTLLMARAAGVRLALVNARLSPASVKGWRRWPGTARAVLDCFDMIVTQNRSVAEDLRAMGADPARLRAGANLKASAAPLPVDGDTLAQMRRTLGTRPLWTASSTHPGEEAQVVAAHRRLCAQSKDACLILIPRHPERGEVITRLLRQEGMQIARRSRGELPDARTDVYLADTLGETGTWYALCPRVFLGGSLVPVGGHNPFEPALFGAAIATGPHHRNFAETFTPMFACGAAQQVADADSLAMTVARWIHQPETCSEAGDAARRFAQSQQSALDDVVAALSDRLSR